MSSSQPAPIRVAVIGAGISGISQAIRLKVELGDRAQVTVYDRDNEAGGVWATSKWPGAGVDVPIHLYSLYSDLNPSWNRHYAFQPEVLSYWQALIDKHDLRSNFRFNSEYTGSQWSEATQSHTLSFRRPSGEQYQVVADVIISANGPLSTPLIPKLPGLDKYEGAYFHNLRWDASYDFRNKRVAVVGNGSSGVQLVPGVAEIEGVQLTHFVRSGGYFIPKINFEYSPAAKFAFRWIPGLQKLYRFNLFLDSNDRWRARDFEDQTRPVKERALLDYLKKEAPAEYLSILTPDYPLGCKRPAFDYGWLRSLHRDNVELVGTKITNADEKGLVTSDGVRREFDVIIFATGSDVAKHGVGLNINLKGEQGLELKSYWDSLGGPKAYLGTAVPQFPNYFAILGPNAIAGSWGYTIGAKADFNARLVRAIVENDLSSIQPTQEAFERHNISVADRLKSSIMKSDLCTNWWRIGDGANALVTVPNPATGFELAAELRSIDWNDWVAVERDPSATNKGKAIAVRKVDVKQRVLERRLKKTVSLSVPLILLVLACFTPTGSRVTDSILKSLRNAYERVVSVF